MNTDGEARAVAALLRARMSGEHRCSVILVTSAFHMRRARLLFARAGLRVIPYPVDFQVSEGGIFTILDLLPAAESLEQTETALREFYGYLYYILRG